MIQEYTVPGGKHRPSYQDARSVSLTMMSHNKRWRGVCEVQEGMCAVTAVIMEAKSITLKNGEKSKAQAASHMGMVPANMG